MADDAVFGSGGKLPAGTRVSAEEITNLNGGAVTAQLLQRALLAIRTADGTAVDVDAADPLPVEDALVATALASLLTAVDGLEGKDYATQTTLAAILTELGQKLEAGGQVALDSATLTALEQIQVGSPEFVVHTRDGEGNILTYTENGVDRTITRDVDGLIVSDLAD